jgi:hypothetical protein
MANERDLVWVEVDKVRPGVVIHVAGELIRVLVGTGTQRPYVAYVMISERSIEGKILRLSKPTFFYGMNERAVRRAALKRVCGRCRPTVFAELRKLVVAS